ncbi:HipA domain-containing protein [Protaetiibacter larvae]|nr:HipA domain-containing protein [Protaetiibacter larvae]
MTGTELVLYLDGVPAGTFWQNAAGNIGFVYDASWRANPRAYPVSMSMPLAATEHRAKPAKAFLWGLLPDSSGALARIARENHVSATNPMALLRAVGRDAAGAVQLLPPGATASDAGPRNVNIATLTGSEFEKMMISLANHDEDWDPGAYGGRWSLAGAQSKVALTKTSDGAWGVPQDSTPTTHILKPGIRGFSNHEINEYLSQRAAQALGMSAAQTELIDAGEAGAVLVSTRFDRALEGEVLHRLHQEDMCQALSVLPDKKYQKDGGPGLAQIADLLSNTSLGDRGNSRRAMFDAVVFNVAIAGTDAHAKNFALMLNAEGQQLAPLYDMASALPYEKRLTKSGPLLAPMRVDGEDRFTAIGRKHLIATARRFSIPAAEAEERIDRILTGTADAYTAAADELTGEVRTSAHEIAHAVRDWGELRGWIEKPPTIITSPAKTAVPKQGRVPKGTPAGGQYDVKVNDEAPDIDLTNV